MFFIYRLLINIIFILSPLIVIVRLFKKKENFFRFKEKYCFFSKKRKEGNLIWFHGASLGELKSIIPLVQKLEDDTRIKQILLTSNTLSSSMILKNFNFKKTIHQFFPIDTDMLSKKFLSYWKPKAIFFINSEIWPNMIKNIKKHQIPLGLINGRISKKTFKKWNTFKTFSKEIFKNFDICLSSNEKSKKFLKELGCKNVNYYGNLKFSQIQNEKISLKSNTKKFFLKKNVWCASSTHKTEEKICGIVHKTLKKKIKNLLTIIIPRHTDRIEFIKKDLYKLKLNVHTDEPKSKINDDTDIYLVNTYGKTKSFFSISKNVFLGGSLINHGGQNPLEAAGYGCNILYGPNVQNFKEIYDFLDEIKISKKIKNIKQLKQSLERMFLIKKNSIKNQKKLERVGNKILTLTLKKIDSLIYNDI